MKILNLNKINNIHFIGIGGISVSGLAKYCLSKNISVSGSDLTENHLTKELENLGATFFLGHHKDNIKKSLTKNNLIIKNKPVKNLKIKQKIKKYINLKQKKQNFNKTILKTYKKPKTQINKIKKNNKTYLKTLHKNQIVVYSGAISKNNPELIYAKQNNIVALERSVFLGVVANNFNNVISVSGTHGKTSTTALLAQIFIEANLNPTVHLGGEVVGSYNNFLIGGNEFFITEACEYKKSFESLHSTHSVITNIEPDHMDCYKNLTDLYNSFNKFANQTKKNVVTNGKDFKKLNTSAKKIICNVLDDYNPNNKNENIKHHKISLNTQQSNSQYFAQNIKINSLGYYSFDVYENQNKIENFSLSITGKYNVYNALYAIVVALQFNIPTKTIKSALLNFKGIKRRNEFMGNIKNLPVYADYAHHPTEIAESLENYKQIYGNILLVFQPHTYSRTKTLLSQFKSCFSNSNNIIIFSTYPAREKYDYLGSETFLFNNINYNKTNKKLCLEKEQLYHQITENIGNNNVILFLGAGDLYNYINKLLD